MSKLYYVRDKDEDIYFELEDGDSRAPEDELIHRSRRALHRANFTETPVLIDKLAEGSIVRV